MIAEAEEALVDALRVAVTVGDSSLVRTVESLPDNFSAAEVKTRLRAAPAIYVTFLGGKPREEASAMIDAEWGIFVLTMNASGERARRTGDATAVGAYELLELVIPAVQALSAASGSFKLGGVNNLFKEELDRLGFSLYSASFTVPMVFQRSDAALPAFETFHADWVKPPVSRPPPALPMTDGVQLPAVPGDTIELHH
jgi:phage gp37-like protein